MVHTPGLRSVRGRATGWLLVLGLGLLAPAGARAQGLAGLGNALNRALARRAANPGGGGGNAAPSRKARPAANSNTLQELRLGASLEAPNATLAEQLDLPKDQGIVVNEVLAESAAAKAGLKPHDILLELDGKTVTNKIADFTKQLGDVKPDTPINVLVLRKGKKETVQGLTLPEGAPKVDPPAAKQAGPNAPKPDPKRAAPGIF